ncbi:glycosyltransferase [bacterium]|nr:glycosyltransferase [candidate division CSSED10-310 bacterium]
MKSDQSHSHSSPGIRIAHVANLARRGGLEIRLVEYLRHRRRDRFQHSVVATAIHSELAHCLETAGVPVYTPPRHLQFDPAAFVHLVRHLQAARYHIIHGRNDAGHIWGVMAGAIAGTPVLIGGEHGTVWSLRGWKRFAEVNLYPRFTAVIANSIATKEMILSRRPCRTDRIRVIYDGIDPTPYEMLPARAVARKRLGLPEDGPVVAAAGRMDTEKAFHVAIQSWRIVTSRLPNARLVIAGAGPLLDDLRRLARELEMQDRIHFPGFLDDITDLYGCADLVLSTSLRETLGNTLIEAGLAGLPVIAPAVDGIPEVVEDGVTGILLEPDRLPSRPRTAEARPLPSAVIRHGRLFPPRALDPGLLGEVTAALLAQPDRCRAMGAAGRRLAMRRFSLDRYIEELETCYEECAGAAGVNHGG